MNGSNISNQIELDISTSIKDFEYKLLSEIAVPSLLSHNLLTQGTKKKIIYSRGGYIPLSEVQIWDIESLCFLIKAFIRAITLSENYLLLGEKHFLEKELIFVNPETKEVKLIFGKINDSDYYYGDIKVVTQFLNSLKKGLEDQVYLQIIQLIQDRIKNQNPKLKSIVLLVDEVEREWYAKNLVPMFNFQGEAKTRSYS